MEASYMCLRCIRHLTRTTRSSTKRVAQFSTTTTNRQTRKWSSQSPVKAAQAVQAQPERDNYETQRYPPNASPYGQYRAPLVLRPDNLFHSFTNSPIPEIRQRAQYIKRNAYCPHPSHAPTRVSQSPNDSESRKQHELATYPPAHTHFECPDCGIPMYCSEEHWADDYEKHLEICDTLKQINEDDHDLRSGRWFHEFEYPGPQLDEIVVNMTNWDTLLYTRQFEAINEDRSLRQATRLLTYPLTIASVLHELSPYGLARNAEASLEELDVIDRKTTEVATNKRFTFEGLKSLSALRYTLHPPRTGQGMKISGLRLQSPPVRIFCLGARAESSIPRDVWLQLSFLFPRAPIHLIFIGPESMANRDSEFPLPERTPDNPFGAIVEDRMSDKMKISTYVEYFHTLHEANQFYPYDPYFDCFVLFHPGLGHPASAHEWESTLPQLLSTKVPIICTGYTDWDMQRDWRWVMEKCAGEVDLLMSPGENLFRSLRWDLNDLDPQDISSGNWGVWAFRGKRYEATSKDE